jgi:hypothetical protein
MTNHTPDRDVDAPFAHRASLTYADTIEWEDDWWHNPRTGGWMSRAWVDGIQHKDWPAFVTAGGGKP